MSTFEEETHRIGKKSPIIRRALFFLAAIAFVVGSISNISTIMSWIATPFKVKTISHSDFNWVEKGTGIDTDHLSFNYLIPERWIEGMFASINAFSYTPDRANLKGFKVYISTYGDSSFNIQPSYIVSEATLNIQSGSYFSVSSIPLYINEGSRVGDSNTEYWFKSISVPYSGTEYKVTCSFSSIENKKKYIELCDYIIKSIVINEWNESS